MLHKFILHIRKLVSNDILIGLGRFGQIGRTNASPCPKPKPNQVNQLEMRHRYILKRKSAGATFMIDAWWTIDEKSYPLMAIKYGHHLFYSWELITRKICYHFKLFRLCRLSRFIWNFFFSSFSFSFSRPFRSPDFSVACIRSRKSFMMKIGAFSVNETFQVKLTHTHKGH